VSRTPAPTPDSEPEDFNVEDELTSADEVPAGAPTDPAFVAAELLLARQLDEDASLRGAVTPTSAVVVRVPSPAWAQPLASAWKATFGPAGSPRFGGRSGFRRVATEPRRDPHAVSVDVEVEDSLWRGHGALGVAEDPVRDLPPALVAAADVRVTVSAVDDGILRDLVQRLTGGRPSRLPRGLSAALQPRHLRLARRPGQSTDDYVGRLASLVAADRTAEEHARPAPPTWTLDRIHGQPELTAFGEGLAADIAAFRKGTLPWSDVSPGVLLSGPPGTGKTLAAQALAHACGVPLVATSYADWQTTRDGTLGDVVKRMRARFAEARVAAPCILFVDELDSVQARGGTSRHDDWWTAIINALLEELDGIAGREGIVVAAASNYPERIDSALRRAGRLDREIHLRLPDSDGLARILREHLGADLPGADLVAAARAGRGGTGADAAGWVRRARAAARYARRAVTEADLVTAIRGEEEAPRPAAVLRRVVYHEAGHAVVAALTRSGMLRAVTVRADGDRAGHADLQLEDSNTPEQVDALLVGLMAGRAAEEVVLGGAGAGCGGPAGSDLARATLLAASAELSWGLGDQLTWRGDPDVVSLPVLLAANPAAAARIEARLRAALAAARDMLRQARRELDAVAEALVRQETLTGDEVEELVAAVRQPVRALPVPGAAAMAGGVR
jgi:mRNA-degrading endonuclease toxin of MazEF toxin-antitoxin module